jgi:Ser/Thr protein kinase RdoA (MazF antagonist)
MTERKEQRQDAWGESLTRFFYELTPDRILQTVEAAGFSVTGRWAALNSMENRVYEVEIEVDAPVASPSDRFRVIKFYRPGRWSRDQILAEHRFLAELVEAEIPVAAPIELAGGGTLAVAEGLDICYAIWPRVGGRVTDELDDERLAQMGRLVARMHNVGSVADAPERVRLDPSTYGRASLESLRSAGVMPADVAARIGSLVETICDRIEPWFEGVSYQRIHGDCHLGNVLWNTKGPLLVDFDDMVRGPCVQDLWLIVPGRDEYALRQRERLLEGYEQMRDFDRRTLRLIEPLRALRMIHFAAWLARRREDPAFQRVFSDFASERYWFEQVSALQEQLALIQEASWQ